MARLRISVWTHLGASAERVSWDGQRLEVWVTLEAAKGPGNRTVEAAIGRALHLHPVAVAVVAGEDTQEKVVEVKGAHVAWLEWLRIPHTGPWTLEPGPANRAVVEFLSPLRPPVRDPYMEAGCHPDAVERVWDRLGRALPRDCRALLGACPVLAHPLTGAVLAFAHGTAYAVLVPLEGLAVADSLGLRPTHRWSNGKVTDLSAEVGEGWCFGTWLDEEYDLCRQAFLEAERRLAT
jgi:uncharacterized protein YggU (UPF0235/DUF167 family)